MHRSHRIAIALTTKLLTLATVLPAQFSGGVNIDFNSTAGAGAGQPTILFGGALSQGGFWNPINPPYSELGAVGIRDLSNSAIAISMFFSWPEPTVTRPAFNESNPLFTEDFARLLLDGLDLGTQSPNQNIISLSTFTPGIYRVATYAISPANPSYRTTVSVRTDQGNYGQQIVGGTGTANSFLQGVTHALHDIPVFTNTTIHLDLTNTSGFGSINGIQIQPLAPTRLFVRAGGGVGAGLSWDAPLSNLQSALALARVIPSVTEIWVARGTYAVDAFPATSASPDATHQLRSNLAIYGHFAGTETNIDQRLLNFPFNQTILQGISTTAANITANNVNNAIIDGLTITNSRTAVSVQNSNLIIRNCVITGNTGSRGVALETTGFGAEVFSTTIDRCTLVNNTGSGSGGLISHTNDQLTIINSLIANNSISFNLIDASVASALTIQSSTFANNLAPGVSGYSRIVGAPTTVIRNSIFWGNVANDQLATETGLRGVIDNVDWTNLSVTDNIIQGWTGTLAPAAAFNNGSDPRFIATLPAGASPTPLPANAYQLASRSPARDSGWNSGTPASFDRLGNPRRIDDPFFPNTGFSGGFIDRGAFEAETPSNICPGDLASQGGLVGPDGIRDNNDFVVFLTLFFTPDPRADLGAQGGVLGADGRYDNNDFTAFVTLFFSECP